MFKKIGLVIISAVSAFAMHNAEINVNEKDLAFGTNFDLGQFNETVEPETTFMGFKYIKASNEYSEDEAGNYVDIEPYVELDFLVKREVQNSGITLGIGVKANYTKVEETFITMPLGLELGYSLPIDMPITFGVSVYYAPESLAFAKASNFFEYRAEVVVELIERAAIIAGYRNLELTYDINGVKSDITYNDAAYFGFRFKF